MPENKTMTTAAGCPMADNQNSLTAGPRGSVLMQDMHLMEKLAHFNRERVLERVVQAVFPVDNFIAVFYFPSRSGHSWSVRCVTHTSV